MVMLQMHHNPAHIALSGIHRRLVDRTLSKLYMHAPDVHALVWSYPCDVNGCLCWNSLLQGQLNIDRFYNSLPFVNRMPRNHFYADLSSRVALACLRCSAEGQATDLLSPR